jgi:hypothetical protein
MNKADDILNLPSRSFDNPPGSMIGSPPAPPKKPTPTGGPTGTPTGGPTTPNPKPTKPCKPNKCPPPH